MKLTWEVIRKWDGKTLRKQMRNPKRRVEIEAILSKVRKFFQPQKEETNAKQS